MMIIPSIFIPEDWSFTFYKGLNRHPVSIFKDKSVAELGYGNGWITIAIAAKWSPMKVYDFKSSCIQWGPQVSCQKPFACTCSNHMWACEKPGFIRTWKQLSSFQRSGPSLRCCQKTVELLEGNAAAISQNYYGCLLNELLAFQLAERRRHSETLEENGWDVLEPCAGLSMVAKPSACLGKTISIEPPPLKDGALAQKRDLHVTLRSATLILVRRWSEAPIYA